MEKSFTEEWTGNHSISPGTLSELVKKWDYLTQGNKLGIFFAVIGTQKDTIGYNNVVPEFLNCLERDIDTEISCLYPLAKNWASGTSLYHNLPADSAFQVAILQLLGQLQEVTFSFRTNDYIFFPPSTRGNPKNESPLALSSKKNFDILSEATTWENSWAYENKGSQPKASATAIQRSKIEKFSRDDRILPSRSASTSKRGSRLQFPSKTGMKHSSMRKASIPPSISGYVPSPINSGQRAQPFGPPRKFTSFIRPPPKVKYIDRDEATKLEYKLNYEKIQAKLDMKYERQRESEARVRNRADERKIAQMAKANDKAALKDRGSSNAYQSRRSSEVRLRSKSARVSVSPPRSSARRFYKSVSGAPSTYVTENESEEGEEDENENDAEEVIEIEDDEGCSPAPYWPGNAGLSMGNGGDDIIDVDVESVEEEEDQMSAELNTALNFPVGTVEPQAASSSVKPNSTKATKAKAAAPTHLPENVEEKLEQLLAYLSSSTILHPDDLTFIRKCLDGKAVKPKHLSSEIYPVPVDITGASESSIIVYFQAYFHPDEQISWDLITQNIDSSLLE